METKLIKGILKVCKLFAHFFSVPPKVCKSGIFIVLATLLHIK